MCSSGTWLSFAPGHTGCEWRQVGGKGRACRGRSAPACGVSLAMSMTSTTWCLTAPAVQELREEHAGLFAASEDLRSFPRAGALSAASAELAPTLAVIFNACQRPGGAAAAVGAVRHHADPQGR